MRRAAPRWLALLAALPAATLAPAAVLAPSAALRLDARGRGPRSVRGGRSAFAFLRATPGSSPEVVDVAPLGEKMRGGRRVTELGTQWPEGMALVPPEDVRRRIHATGMKLGKHNLAYVGDCVWEYLVLKHQLRQETRSPFTESQKARTHYQAKAAGLLWRSEWLTSEERMHLRWGAEYVYQKKAVSNYEGVVEAGLDQYCAACGLRTLLGVLYIDGAFEDSRLQFIAEKIGLLGEPGEEERLLAEVTDGIYEVSRPPTMYFLALAPLGYCALRLYVTRYLSERPLHDKEFAYRLQIALRDEELDRAAEGFVRSDATPEEVELMKAARDQQDSYSFAFQCLLGHLAVDAPYRLHQILSIFGWAVPLEGTRVEKWS